MLDTLVQLRYYIQLFLLYLILCFLQYRDSLSIFLSKYFNLLRFFFLFSLPQLCQLFYF